MSDAKDPLIPTDKVAAQAKLLADDDIKDKFIKAIEDQITQADKQGTVPLVDYIHQVQNAGRDASEALAKLVMAKAEAVKGLTGAEQAVLHYFLQDPSGTIEKVMAKFAANLDDPNDKATVNTWLSLLTERERSYVTTGAIVGRDIDAGLFLAVNLYRATLAGVSTEKMRSALRICQIYCGLPAYVAASQTLVALGEVLHEIKKDATPADVIAALIKRFDFAL